MTNKIIKINTSGDNRQSKDFQRYEKPVTTILMTAKENYKAWNWGEFNEHVLSDSFPDGKILVILPHIGPLDFYMRLRAGIESPENGKYWHKNVRVTIADE